MCSLSGTMSSTWEAVRARHSEVAEGRGTCGKAKDGMWMSCSVSQVWFPGKLGILGDHVCRNIW